MIYRTPSCLVVATLMTAASTLAADQESLDVGGTRPSRCELLGLIGHAPEGWSNDPMQFADAGLAGCEMVRGGQNGELLGFVRVLSVAVPDGTPKDKWLSGLIDLEVGWLQEAGITLGKPLFRRDDVPLSGLGDFENGTGIGLEASSSGSDSPREVHFLGFNGPGIQYLLTLVTTARKVDEGIEYQRNIEDFGVLMRTLQLPAQ